MEGNPIMRAEWSIETVEGKDETCSRQTAYKLKSDFNTLLFILLKSFMLTVLCVAQATFVCH